MVLIIDEARDPTQDEILRAMFAARKRVFVDLLGWDVPVLDGYYEIDQFDDPNATYLIISDASGRHLGSARLLETVRPHILDTLFPHLCDHAIPRGHHVREITRFCLDRNQTARQRRETRNQLISALVDHALANNISTYTGVAEMAWFQQILAFGWRCRSLGRSHGEGASGLAALRIDIGEDTIERLTSSGIYPVSGQLRPTLQMA